MRAVYTVGLRRHVLGATDSHGNPIDSWAPAVDVPVYAIAPTYTNEPVPGRAEVVEGLQILAPTGSEVPGPRDRVVIDGVEYEVDGEVADWTRGPFGFDPGVSYNLKRAEG